MMQRIHVPESTYDQYLLQKNWGRKFFWFLLWQERKPRDGLSILLRQIWIRIRVKHQLASDEGENRKQIVMSYLWKKNTIYLIGISAKIENLVQKYNELISKLEFMIKMTSKINIIEELDLAGPTLILNKEDEQRLLESDNEDTTPNAQSVRIWNLVYIQKYGFYK